MRIAVVNDMSLAVESLRRVLTNAPAHELAWVARDGEEAVQRAAEDRPDLILMDLIMPRLNGAEATRRIMAVSPCPILVVTASVGGNASLVFEAMGAGALDAVRTPVLAQQGGAGAATLLDKIATIEKLVRPVPARRSRFSAPVAEAAAVARKPLLALGASTGGPKALAAVLSALPPDYAAGIVVVQHVDQQFSAELAAWLDAQTPNLVVRLARPGDRPEAGLALVAGTNDHLILDASLRLDYTPEPREQVYRPSVDVFFESVAARWRGDVAAALLTGMGRDGAMGLLRLKQGGAHTIAEHESTCAVYGMPKAAAQLNAARQILPLGDIAPALAQVFRPCADTGSRGAA
ncbi:MAG TPA: chemotaxis response regulator protein-glutamate methylesterase [Gammaproteobacteria bacterium]|nr:chemotaxis response regulator protein-glutamate methylesterase [Gammaproteobacteria bacterium]